MSQVYEHNPGDHEDPVAGTTWLVGIIFAVAVVISLLGLTALLYDVQREEEEVKIVAPESMALIQLQGEQAHLLQGAPRRVEELVGEDVAVAIVIPLERAMELVVAENSGDTDRP